MNRPFWITDPLLSQIRGLRPRAWICVGSGFSREDLKAQLTFSEDGGVGFVGDAFTTLDGICFKLIQEKGKVLGAASRQEVLRELLARPKMAGLLPELAQLKRQQSFYSRLDRALQNGRMAFANDSELETFEDRLQAQSARSALRQDLRKLTFAYETFLRSKGLWDLPMLLNRAIEVLERAWPETVSKPETLLSFSTVKPESLEALFWERIQTQLELVSISQAELGELAQVSWERWHTLDDAAESLAERFGDSDFSDQAVIIPDSSEVRRALGRALRAYHLPLFDPRDPTRIRWDEGIKRALFPLEVVAKNFQRTSVIAWASESAEITEINERGIMQGLGSYAGGKLQALHARLDFLKKEFGGRNTCATLAKRHLAHLSATFAPELVSFFEALWKNFEEDLILLDQGDRRAPLLYWLERLRLRLNEMPAPVEKLKPAEGVLSYRIHQAPLKRYRRVFVLGLPPEWNAQPGRCGDYWWSERDREILAGEFQIKSKFQLSEERTEALRAWLHSCEEIVFLDASYEAQGRERESILPVLEACGVAPEMDEKGGHPRVVRSFGAIRPLPPQTFDLPEGPKDLSATTLDRYSRCAFQGLVFGRWKLWDAQEPSPDLWPDVNGNLLHEAVRRLVDSHCPAREAMLGAWEQVQPKGLLRSERVKRYVQERIVLVLESFLEQEQKYLDRSHARPVSLDESKLKLDFSGVTIVGKPDRIDETAQGLFVIDYKTGAKSPSGTTMLEKAYRLQLPFYALAAQNALKKPVLGVQFVELKRRASRSSGIFFKATNGKEDGKLTQVRSNSKSLLAYEDPQQVWKVFQDHITLLAHSYQQGHFEAAPKDPQECRTCQASDLCGFRRKNDVEEGSDGV